jgi:hypothetical protein
MAAQRISFPAEDCLRQSLRGTLLGAYQAWQITLLVMALGVAFTAMGMAFPAVTVHPGSIRGH